MPLLARFSARSYSDMMVCRYLYLVLLSACLGLLLAACGAPETPPADRANYLTRIPDPKTLGERYVSDPDTILGTATVQELDATLQALDQSGRAHIDVVLARSIGEAVPKTAATALFDRWKIGDKTKDNGLLMLLVLDQRRIEFETGYGLEGDLPDAICYRIQQRDMVPLVRAGRYDEAVRAGVAAIIRQLNPDSAQSARDKFRADSALVFQDPYDAIMEVPRPSIEVQHQQLARREAASDKAVTGLFSLVGAVVAGLLCLVLYGMLWEHTAVAGTVVRVLLVVFLVLTLGVIVVTFFARPAGVWVLFPLVYGPPLLYVHGYLAAVNVRNRAVFAPRGRHAQHEYLHEAHYKLDFTAFAFPVLLALYWPWHRRRMQQLRDAPYACPTCARPMHRLSETDDDEHMELGQVAEEMVKSVDYDVWQCDQCPTPLVLGYRNLTSSALPCPECHHRTYRPKRKQVVQAATRSAGGWGWQPFKCEYCGHKHQEKYTIPQLPSPSSGSSGGSSSSWSSGSSSSGSSSSSSSGGSSGGGGAGSSW